MELPPLFHSTEQQLTEFGAAAEGQPDNTPMSATALPGNLRQAERQGFPVNLAGDTAVIPIQGLMLKAAPRWAVERGIACSMCVTAAPVRMAAAETGVSRVVMPITSGGGSVLEKR